MTLNETDKELQETINLENIARSRCYRRWSRIKYVELSESQRKSFMENCMRVEVQKLRDKQKNDLAIEGRRSFEEMQKERNRERLKEIREFREMDESLSGMWNK